MSQRPGLRTTEFGVTATTMLIAAGVLVFSRDPVERRIAVSTLPAAAGFYAHSRGRVKAAGPFDPAGTTGAAEQTSQGVLPATVAAVLAKGLVEAFGSLPYRTPSQPSGPTSGASGRTERPAK